MSVSLRLNRKGTKDRPYYKIVAVDSRKRRDGRYIEQLGTYDPLQEGTNFSIDLEIADKWLAVGAQPSETVKSMIRKARTAAAVRAPDRQLAFENLPQPRPARAAVVSFDP